MYLKSSLSLFGSGVQLGRVDGFSRPPFDPERPYSYPRRRAFPTATGASWRLFEIFRGHALSEGLQYTLENLRSTVPVGRNVMKSTRRLLRSCFRSVQGKVECKKKHMKNT